jgi:integrase/recombinase XerD
MLAAGLRIVNQAPRLGIQSLYWNRNVTRQQNRQFCCGLLLDMARTILSNTERFTNLILKYNGHPLKADTACNPIDDFVARRFAMTAFEAWHRWQILDEAGRRKYLNGAERARFLGAADGLAPQMRALCHVLAYAGCRVSEALALSIHHVDAERLTLTIKTLKRRRDIFRNVPVPQATIAMLRMLPLDATGRFWSMHRVTAWRVVKAEMHRAGIAGPMACPKGLRHGFGVRAAGHNVPTNLIQRWMGHASPTTTAIYLDVVGVEERQFASRMW